MAVFNFKSVKIYIRTLHLDIFSDIIAISPPLYFLFLRNHKSRMKSLEKRKTKHFSESFILMCDHLNNYKNLFTKIIKMPFYFLHTCQSHDLFLLCFLHLVVRAHISKRD